MFKQILRCYLHVITKEQGKGKWALPTNLRRLLTTIWQRKDVWKTLFQNKSSGTINPAYLPLELLNNTKNVPIKKHCLSQLLPNIFILQLGRNIPLTTMTSIVFCFEKSAMERNTSTVILWTWGRTLLKGIFLSNFWNLFMLSNKQLLNCGRYADRCSPAAAVWPILACRAQDLTRAEVSQSCGGYCHITHNFTVKAPGGRGSSALSK